MQNCKKYRDCAYTEIKGTSQARINEANYSTPELVNSNIGDLKRRASLQVQTVGPDGRLMKSGLVIPEERKVFGVLPDTSNPKYSNDYQHTFRDLLSNDELMVDAIKRVETTRKIKQRNPDESVCYEKMVSYVEKQGLDKPSGSKAKAIIKMVKVGWWKAALKKQDRLLCEHERRCAGIVSRNKSAYASVNARSMQVAYELSLEQYLKSKRMVNESTGEVVTMWDIAQHTNFNAVVKLAETTKRLDGMQDQAEREGLVAKFLTITCPSKFHRFSKDRFNQKFDESLTSKDAKKHLSKVVKDAHKRLSNAGIPVIGMRVLEPHHDGTPHLHAVVWATPDNIEEVVNAYKVEALAVDGGERGAAENRFDCKDMVNGGAVGYLMKYLTKNLNQESDLVDDQTGKQYSESNVGISAWVRLNSIVQFAFWGDCGIGVFRQLYKVGDDVGHPVIQAMVNAARDNDYGAYIELQGGLGTAVADRRVKAVNELVRVNADGEEIKQIAALSVDGLRITLERDTWSELPLTVASETRSLEVIKRLPESAVEPIESTVSASDLSQQDYTEYNGLIAQIDMDADLEVTIDENMGDGTAKTELLRDRRKVLRW